MTDANPMLHILSSHDSTYQFKRKKLSLFTRYDPSLSIEININPTGQKNSYSRFDLSFS